MKAINFHPILSVLVISHNQRELLRRCMASVLSQKIHQSWEVVISDDRSTDGTFELAAEYASAYESSTIKADGCFSPMVKAVRCNSDECNPVSLSERCGWNKLTAWSHARGKYMVNIDADDYLKSDDIYQLQIDALEAHPECSMCQQRVWQVNDGANLSTGKCWPKNKKLVDGAVVSAEDTIIEDMRGLNQSYMMRRRKDDDMRALYGKHYDDTVITLHNLQYGPAIFIDRADYVWVQYKKSISNSLSKEETTVLYGLLPICHALFIPKLAGLFIYGGLQEMIHMFKMASEKPSMTKPSVGFLKEFNGFVFGYYTEKRHSLWNRLRYKICRLSLLLCKKFKLFGPVSLKFLFALMVNGKSADAIRKEYWRVK